MASVSRLNEPAVREKFHRVLQSQRLDLDHIRIAWAPGAETAEHFGKTLAEYVEFVRKPAADALTDLLFEERMGVLCVMDEGDDRLVRPFLQHPRYMMGSDGIYHPDGLVHPRMFGSAGRLLGPCVREWKLFSLEAAVHKMTGKPAARFGLEGGELREGEPADLVVFDPATIADHATFDDPLRPTTGVERVYVNGTAILQDGVCLAADRVANSIGQFPPRVSRTVSPQQEATVPLRTEGKQLPKLQAGSAAPSWILTRKHNPPAKSVFPGFLQSSPRLHAAHSLASHVHLPQSVHHRLEQPDDSHHAARPHAASPSILGRTMLRPEPWRSTAGDRSAWRARQVI